jgi:hypothetical protein
MRSTSTTAPMLKTTKNNSTLTETHGYVYAIDRPQKFTVSLSFGFSPSVSAYSLSAFHA